MRDMLRRLLNESTLAFWIFAAIGTFFVALGLIFAVPTLLQLNSFARAEGSVVDYSQRGDTTYPIVQFTTPDGRRWEFEDRVGSDPPQFKLEQNVDVRYDSSNPRNAFVNTAVNLWVLPGIFCLVGGVFALIGWAGVVSVFRHRRMG